MKIHYFDDGCDIILGGYMPEILLNTLKLMASRGALFALAYQRFTKLM